MLKGTIGFMKNLETISKENLDNNHIAQRLNTWSFCKRHIYLIWLYYLYIFYISLIICIFHFMKCYEKITYYLCISLSLHLTLLFSFFKDTLNGFNGSKQNHCLLFLIYKTLINTFVYNFSPNSLEYLHRSRIIGCMQMFVLLCFPSFSSRNLGFTLKRRMTCFPFFFLN